MIGHSESSLKKYGKHRFRTFFRHATVIERTFQRLTASALLGTHFGSLRMELSTNRTVSQRISDEMATTIMTTGILVALGAIVIGTWLGWH